MGSIVLAPSPVGRHSFFEFITPDVTAIDKMRRNGGTVMKTIQPFVVFAALAFAMAAPTSAAQSDPEVIIYRFPGVRDDGAVASTGVATVFHCVSFSGVSETLRFATRDSKGKLLQNDAFP